MEPVQVGNLFDDAGAPPTGERFDELLRHRNLVVERIVSSSDITPTEYVQAQDEWVLLLRGSARMTIAGQVVDLRAGEHIFLPAGVPHRVDAVSQGATWLAVHLHPTGV